MKRPNANERRREWKNAHHWNRRFSVRLGSSAPFAGRLIFSGPLQVSVYKDVIVGERGEDDFFIRSFEQPLAIKSFMKEVWRGYDRDTKRKMRKLLYGPRRAIVELLDGACFAFYPVELSEADLNELEKIQPELAARTARFKEAAAKNWTPHVWFGGVGDLDAFVVEGP